MAQICKDVQEWVEEKVEKPIEERIKKTKKKCKKKKCKWYCGCCNKWFCWLETFFVTVVRWVVVWVGKWVTRVVCETVSIILDIVGFIVGLIFAIPVIGRIIHEIWDIGVEIGNRFIGIVGTILDILGLELTKKLRICIIILRDEKQPTATPASLQPEIDKAKKIYKDATKVSLHVHGIHTVDKPSPESALDVGCNAQAWGEDLWLPGSYYEWIANTQCFDGAGRRLIGWGAPVVVFAVRSVEGNTDGCSLGPFSDYVTVEGPNPHCFAHEIGHACSLWHYSSDGKNLMNPVCGGTKLKKWQRVILRSSRHVTYL